MTPTPAFAVAVCSLAIVLSAPRLKLGSACVFFPLPAQVSWFHALAVVERQDFLVSQNGCGGGSTAWLKTTHPLRALFPSVPPDLGLFFLFLVLFAPLASGRMETIISKTVGLGVNSVVTSCLIPWWRGAKAKRSLPLNSWRKWVPGMYIAEQYTGGSARSTR